LNQFKNSHSLPLGVIIRKSDSPSKLEYKWLSIILRGIMKVCTASNVLLKAPTITCKQCKYLCHHIIFMPVVSHTEVRKINCKFVLTQIVYARIPVEIKNGNPQTMI